MAFTCASCRRRTSGSPVVSVTGRRLCRACSDNLRGMAAGMLAAGSDASTGAAMGQAIATGGVFARLRAWRRRNARAAAPEDSDTKPS